MNIIVGIATAGRAEVLLETLNLLKLQTRLPDSLVICPLPLDPISSTNFDAFPVKTTVLKGPTGLCAQRNTILSGAGNADLIVFFDDDFLVDREYLANAESILEAHPDVTALTGNLLADGARGPGFSILEGLKILNAPRGRFVEKFEQLPGTYGCNMAFRLAPIREHNLRFDENLPLYGWQEDIDFSLRQAPFGRVIKSNKLLGVHLGVKSGRTSGVRFGYSQIANPIYLVRKGTMSWQHARKLMWRNIASNLLRSVFPEPWIDRKGRLRGNLIALGDIVMNRLSPLRILQL
jgi:GT2 family glycosyltransferase